MTDSKLVPWGKDWKSLFICVWKRFKLLI